MNDLRQVTTRSLTGFKTFNQSTINKNTKKTFNKNNTKKVQKNKSDREVFKDQFSRFVNYHIYKANKLNKKKYDKVKLLCYKAVLKDIDKNYYALSKKIKHVYKYNGIKIKKIDADTIVLNFTKNYINDINNKFTKTDSLFDIYATYNCMVDGISYEYLNDFHNNIKGDIEKLRDGFAVKTDLKRPKYLNKKIGKGRKEIFKLAFRLVTLSEEVTCDLPRKKYLEVCYTKEDFIYVYKLLGKGIRHYMKYYDIAPLFKVFVKSLNKSDILNMLGYKGYKINKDGYLGICALLFTQLILSTYGTLKGIRSMLEVQSESCNQLVSLMGNVKDFNSNNKCKYYKYIKFIRGAIMPL